MLVALFSDNLERAEAAKADKANSHICPGCKEKVILAQGKVRRPYFRHPAGSDCLYGVAETWQHQQAKTAILEGARAKGLAAEVEVEVLSIEGDRRADVLVFAPQTDPPKDDKRRRLAFEVQYSPIPYENFSLRTYAYMAAGVPVCWLPVVDQQKLKSLARIEGTNIYQVEEYSVPSWIDSIHSLHQTMWFYIPQTSCFWKAWLLPNWRYKNPSEGYDSSGDYHSSGGYWYKAAILRDLYLEGPYDFSSLKMVRVNRSSHKFFKAKGLPAYVVELKMGVADAVDCPVIQVRQPHMVDGKETGFYTYVARLRRGDQEFTIRLEPVEQLPVASTQGE